MASPAYGTRLRRTRNVFGFSPLFSGAPGTGFEAAWLASHHRRQLNIYVS